MLLGKTASSASSNLICLTRNGRGCSAAPKRPAIFNNDRSFTAFFITSPLHITLLEQQGVSFYSLLRNACKAAI